MEVRQQSQISSAFIWRRLHSLMGLWMVLYLVLHLLTNSQAALWLGDSGSGFIRMVNSLESLPYLPVVETVLIGVPFAIHMVWGVYRIFSARTNAAPSDGSKPSLQYERNWAYTWQRLSSWILLFGIIGHVVQMRFLDQPQKFWFQDKEYYSVVVSSDEGLHRLAPRLDVTLYDGTEQDPMSQKISQRPLGENQLVAVATSPGTAILLMVRDTFKSPLMIALYSIFVLAAAFHAFNGFWTFLITWGVILSYRSQKTMIPVSVIGMGLLLFFGFAAIYGSYWLNQYG